MNRETLSFWKVSVGWFLMAGALASFAGCGEAVPGDISGVTKEAALSAKQVTVIRAQAQKFKRLVEFTGTLVARTEAVVRALQEGPIVAMNVDIGDRVSAGDLLFRTRDVDARLAVQTSQARLDTSAAAVRDLQAWKRSEEVEIQRARTSQARLEFERLRDERQRMKALLEKGAVSDSAWDLARTSAEAAEANLRIQEEQLRMAEAGPTPEQLEVAQRQQAEAEVALSRARQALSDTSVRAPFSGTVTARLRQAGDYARRGDEIIEIKQLKTLYAEIDVPERYASALSVGLPAEVLVESADLRRQAGVVAVNNSIDPGTRTFRVKVEVNNSDTRIKAGAFCTARFELPGREGSLAVPSEAVRTEEGRVFVWVVQDSKARQVAVRLGERDGDLVEVREGLDGREQLVVGGGGALAENDVVEIVSEMQ